MYQIPGILKKSRTVKRIREYMDSNFSEVVHTTLNPEGPGVIRIHLVPPKNEADSFGPGMAIINGADMVPVNFYWCILLAEFIKQVNVYDGKAISENEIASILGRTTEEVRKTFPGISKKSIKSDLEKIYITFRQIAYRQEVTTDVGFMNIGQYAPFMKAPHRMDLMVSAMTRDGKWHCNQKCVHCYAAGQPCSEEKELSTQEWKTILDNCREACIPQVTFTGGEPTMRDDLPELIEYARWFVSRLNTNGIRLTEDYCRSLREAELDSVQITFYSSDREIHNTLVGAEQFDNTARGIENALAAGLCVSINTPLCTLNRDYVKTLGYLHDKGIIYVTCSGLITTGNAGTEKSRSLQLSVPELKQILEDAVKFCADNGMEISFTSPGWLDREFIESLGLPVPSCGACLSNMAVTPGGNVVPCQSWLSDGNLGNMLTDSWDDIWNNQTCVSQRNFSSEMSGICPLRRWC